MTPEQLIAEVEALLPSGPDQVVTKFDKLHRWHWLAPLVLDALRAMQASLERLTTEREDLRAQLTAREEECRELESRRLMAYRAYCDVSRRLDEEERDRKEDRARAMASLDQEKQFHAEELDQLRAMGWALICDATNAEGRASGFRAWMDIEMERRQKAEAERDEARAELARLTTPRPIEEAPKDGTWIVGLWPDRQDAPADGLQWRLGGWRRHGEPEGCETHAPTHFLPLPVKP